MSRNTSIFALFQLPTGKLHGEQSVEVFKSHSRQSALMDKLDQMPLMHVLHLAARLANRDVALFLSLQLLPLLI
jgi:hypothetical protein